MHQNPDVTSPVPLEPAASRQVVGNECICEAVRLCQSDSEFLEHLRHIYSDVDDAIGRLGPICLGGGACCRFDLAAHRLYLSTGDLALLAQRQSAALKPRVGRCAYQIGPRCTARENRPRGCRTHFCNTPTSSALTEIYENNHARIRHLHGSRTLPYQYIELTSALRRLLGRSAGTF